MTSFSELFGGGGGGFDFEIIEKQTFITSGTWTKPVTALDTDIVVAYVIGGGGGGNTGTTYEGGGGGGGQVIELLSSSLSATETVTVGAGGVTPAGAGGSSIFSTYTVTGGNTSTRDLRGGSAGKWQGCSGGEPGTGYLPQTDGATYGGGGGAGRFEPGSISVFAGNGGNASTAGTIPGGGGGQNAVGARGQVTVYVVRGSYPDIDAIIIL
tara:strand:- start:1972 stop:2604 length:633 start_codon:yes stop_codon:yes gene_type:complete